MRIEAWLLLVIGEVPQSQGAEEFLKILHNSSDIFKHINWQVLLTNKEVTFWKYICPLSIARLILWLLPTTEFIACKNEEGGAHF